MTDIHSAKKKEKKATNCKNNGNYEFRNKKKKNYRPSSQKDLGN